MKILSDAEIEQIRVTAVAVAQRKSQKDKDIQAIEYLEHITVLAKEFDRVNAVKFAFDFDCPLLTVFSLERNKFNTNNEETVIGYILHSAPAEVREWHYSCSREQHNDIVVAFTAYLKTKNTAKEPV